MNLQSKFKILDFANGDELSKKNFLFLFKKLSCFLVDLSPKKL